MSDFYVGYASQAPPTLTRRVRRVVLALGTIVALLAIGLVSGQQEFDSAVFEYGQARTLRGVVEEGPVPALRVKQPGDGAPESHYPIVGAGKHGAGDELKQFDGREVELRGMLIYRQGITLLELVPNTVRMTSVGVNVVPPREELGSRTFVGEIVDTKCYAGVMNPGRGKVHRDCAARCISGGIPPALLSGDTIYYLVSGDQQVPSAALLEFISRPAVVSGRLFRRGNTLYIDVGASGISCARQTLKE